MSNSRTPSFWFVVERRDNRVEAIRDSCPHFRVLTPPSFRGEDFECADLVELECACVVSWFRELARRYPCVQVTVSGRQDPSQDPARDPSRDPSQDHVRVLLEYVEEDVSHAVPLPWTESEMSRGLSQSSMGKRLCDLLFSEREVIPLDHQARVLHQDFAGGRSLLMWTMGSGKTRAAGLLSAQAIASGDVRRVIVVAHKTNLGNWELTLSRMPQPAGTRAAFTIVGHAEFSHQAAKSDAWVREAYLIVDESQVYRSLTPAMRFPVQQIQSAQRLLCLSGTPLVNGYEDMAGFLSVIAGWDPDRSLGWCDGFAKSASPSADRTSLLAQVSEACAGHVSYYDPRVHTPELFAAKYPVIEHVDVRVPLTWHQALLHQFEELPSVLLFGATVPLSTGNSYHTHTKQLMVSGVCLDDVSDGAADDVLNVEAESPKLGALLSKLEIHHPDPQVVHSHYVEYGANQVWSMLKHRHPDWTVRMITGSTRADDRTAWVEEFSRRAPVIHVLIITDASATGTDVRGARAMHKLGRANNISTEQQIDGRCARYGSHKQGDPLTIYNYIAVFDGERGRELALVPDEIRDTAIDEMLSLTLRAKRGVRKQMDLALERAGGRDRVSTDILTAMGLFRSDLQTYEELLHETNVRKQCELDEILGVIRAASST